MEHHTILCLSLGLRHPPSVRPASRDGGRPRRAASLADWSRAAGLVRRAAHCRHKRARTSTSNILFVWTVMRRCMPALNTICSTDAKQSVSAPALYALGQRLHHVDSAVDSVRGALADAHCHAKWRPQLAASALPTPARCPRAKVRLGPGLPTRQAQGGTFSGMAGDALACNQCEPRLTEGGGVKGPGCRFACCNAAAIGN